MKKVMGTLLACFMAAGLTLSPVSASEKKPEDVKKAYLVYDIKTIEPSALKRFKNDAKVLSWCQIDNKLIITCAENDRPKIPFAVKSVRSLDAVEKMSEPFLAMRRGKASPLDEYKSDIKVLYENGAYTIFQAPMFVINDLSRQESNHFKLEKFDQSLPLRIDSKFLEIPAVKRSKVPFKAEVDSERIARYIKTLEGFKTRYSYAEGYLKSAEWAAAEFKKMGLEVKMHEYTDGSRKQVNVVAQKSFETPGNFYIVCAHLDSTSPKAQTDAPGADDNASGSAGVLEAANILSKTQKAGNFRFVLFAGEEVGLKGSTAYVKELKASGELSKVLGTVNFDMIGFDKTPPLSSLFETYENYKDFIANFISAAQEQTDETKRLKITVSYRPWGSDHIPFLKAQIPCFLFIEDEFEANSNYHQTTDKFEFINLGLCAEFVRVTTSALMNMASQN
ncbi:MAG: Aminopeptidase S [bacterium ADurb.Bin243]|nr:MAG: Aminopeptidase S [bacterium ADurb.Bin243]